MDGLILFAHGARDSRWAAPFEAVAERVRAARPDAAVRLAYLDLMPPTLLDVGCELADAGCRRVAVLPVFLGKGGHVQRDLPLLADALRRARPQLEVVVHPSVGEHAELLDAIAAVAAAKLAEPAR